MFNFEGPKAEVKGNSEINGDIAQLGEHLLCKQGVNGSIPFISTTSEVMGMMEDEKREKNCE